MARLEAATKRCGRKRIREASAELCRGGCNQSLRVVVFVASDDKKVRERLIESFASLGSSQHMTVVTHSPTGGYRHDDIAYRGTSAGQLAAAADLLLLGHADVLIRAGNRGFSSLSAVATAVEPKPLVESLVVHPCEEEHWWKPEYDCITNLRSQPRMLMRWPLDDSERERERISCQLYDRAGNARTLAQRMQMLGSLDQWCEDLYEMGRFSYELNIPSSSGTPGKVNSKLKSEL